MGVGVGGKPVQFSLFPITDWNRTSFSCLPAPVPPAPCHTGGPLPQPGCNGEEADSSSQIPPWGTCWSPHLHKGVIVSAWTGICSTRGHQIARSRCQLGPWGYRAKGDKLEKQTRRAMCHRWQRQEAYLFLHLLFGTNLE